MIEDQPPHGPKLYHGFGDRLHHEIPRWVRDDAIYHIRVRCEPGIPALTSPEIAHRLLESTRYYHERQRWWVHFFLLMPDHWHALLSFGLSKNISRTIGDWKRYQARQSKIVWQQNYFDHRLRNHLEELDAKYEYIRQNPVVAGLCTKAEDWRWQWRPEITHPDTRPE